MKNDEDISDTNRPEPKENHILENGIISGLNTPRPGIKRSLTFYRSTKIKDTQKRIAYLKRKLTEYRQDIRYPYEYYDEYDFEKCISLEIENLEEEYRHSQQNDQNKRVIGDYDYELMTAIYSVCIDYDVFSYSLIDFLNYIETAHFEIEKNVLPHRSFRYLIYFLQTPLGKPWYHSVVEHTNIPVTRFGGLRNAGSIEDFVKELDKVYADRKKRY